MKKESQTFLRPIKVDRNLYQMETLVVTGKTVERSVSEEPNYLPIIIKKIEQRYVQEQFND